MMIPRIPMTIANQYCAVLNSRIGLAVINVPIESKVNHKPNNTGKVNMALDKLNKKTLQLKYQ